MKFMYFQNKRSWIVLGNTEIMVVMEDTNFKSINMVKNTRSKAKATTLILKKKENAKETKPKLENI